ncbi:unnamed protein product [Adineta ricciae]|uniref:Reverse transcriptase domain-containing protein n=1 Tax=Adineta ricciae TaxID=249248 RepID=A0A814WWI9_ADIRI|nr:unnamed protein product [Adineta ricciae]CAF1207150.1 unnamed protein product [Adineta ricciae]
MKGSNDFGGVLIAIHKSINAQRVKSFDDIENLIVLEIGEGSSRFQLVTCYSPPLEEIPFDIFDQILARNKRTILTGDLNAKHRAWSKSVENPKGLKLFKWLTRDKSHCALNVINKFVPTSTRSIATIDLVIAPTFLANNTFSVLPSIGSDHHPVIWHSSIEASTKHILHPIKRTRWKLLEIFLTFTGSFWQSLASTMSHSADYFTLYERFLSLAASRVTFVSHQQAFKPSLPPELVKAIEHKRSILKLYRRTGHPFFVNALRSMTKIVQKQLFEHKRNSWMEYCNSFNEGNVKSFWKKTKHHFKNKSESIEGFINSNNSTITTLPADMCKIAKDFYSEQFTNHTSSHTNIEVQAEKVEKEIEEALRNSPPAHIEIAFDQLRHAIKTLKNKSSCGLDGVSNKILKLLPPNHLTTVHSCMNNFARTLKTPDNWHIARMILLSKAKSKTIKIDETRPISLLSCFSKIFEKCFMIQFRQWIHDQGILPAEQSGFRPGHNMAVRLVSIVDQIGQCLSKNTAAAALFVDFRSAFNQTWFGGLWLKLNNLHCPLHFIAWLRHYMKDRKAYIDIKNSTSDLFILEKGVPQGSCIGPLLFIVYHFDILESLKTIHYKHLFADDLAIVIAPSPYLASASMILDLTEQIKQVLKHLIDYANKWKQPINFSKTFWTLFHRQVAPKTPSIEFEGQTIHHTKNFKYLGTILDAKLSFSEHIDYIKAKLQSNLNIFKKLAYSRMLNEKSKSRLFNAFIRPHFQSLLNVYPILSPSKQKSLEGFNRKIYRTMHLWFDARNIEIEHLPTYQSISNLVNKHWDKLSATILRTNPDIIEDFLQHKLSILYMREYLTNPTLSDKRKKIFRKGRIGKNIRKLITENKLSLFDHVLCYKS